MSSNETPPKGRSAEPAETGPPGGRTRVEAIRQVLETVTDPEIPVLNVIEMGLIADIRIEEGRSIIDLTPTFAGCPAIDLIRETIRATVAGLGDAEVIVNIVYDPPWTSDRITPSGRRKLKAFGLAPPVSACGGHRRMPDLRKIPCPFCDSTDTELESLFGPTLCRSMHYCRDCLQSFEHFKEVQP